MLDGWFGWLLLAVIVIVPIQVYNRLVALKNRYQNSFAQIDVQLKRRHDLIPNLVETARAYLKHERETLEAVIQARDAAVTALQKASSHPGSAAALASLGRAEEHLSGALGRLQVTMEAYPELKADQSLHQLSEELTSTENRVAYARQAFNDAVMEYNSYRQSVPAIWMAGLFGHRRDASLLSFADRATLEQAPKVQL